MTFRAVRSGTCRVCGDPIEKGDPIIVKEPRGYASTCLLPCHLRCFEGEKEKKIKVPVIDGKMTQTKQMSEARKIDPDFVMIRLKKAADKMDDEQRRRLARMLVIYVANLSKRKL